jgi:DNA-binding PadR family transcriptional regulator
VLCLLHVAPLHPYGMQRLIKLWGKDAVVNVGQRANLYKTIKRLHEAGLVTIRQTERDQQYPERTVYELTDEGRQEGVRWLVDMLANPRNEYPQFPAALSFAMLLPPDEVASELEKRTSQLEALLRRLDADLQRYSAQLPRITLLEDEYRRTVLAAELAWLKDVIAELRTGTLTWNAEMLASLALEHS